MADRNNPRPGGQGPDTNPLNSLQLPYNMQQQQEAKETMNPKDVEADMISRLQDPQTRSQAAATLASQGIEPPASLNELAPPQPVLPQQQSQMDDMQGASQNLETMRQMMTGGNQNGRQ